MKYGLKAPTYRIPVIFTKEKALPRKSEVLMVLRTGMKHSGPQDATGQVLSVQPDLDPAAVTLPDLDVDQLIKPVYVADGVKAVELLRIRSARLWPMCGNRPVGQSSELVMYRPTDAVGTGVPLLEHDVSRDVLLETPLAAEIGTILAGGSGDGSRSANCGRRNGHSEAHRENGDQLFETRHKSPFPSRVSLPDAKTT